MKHSFTALCWAVIVLGLAIACSKKPAPTKPGPAPEKDYGSETAIADVGRGRGHTLADFDKPLLKASVGGVEFSPVYFPLNSTTPTGDSRETLQTLVEEAPKYRSCTIEGHTCPLGEEVYNLALGHHRGQAVLNYLRVAGVRTSLQVISYGEERPVTLDDSEYWQNRRVVVECVR